MIAETAIVHPGVIVGEGAVVMDYAVIEEGCVIGEGARVGCHAVLRPQTMLGPRSVLSHLCVSEGDNVIGADTTIEAQCHITRGAVIAERVFIAPFFCGANTRRISHGRDYEPKVEPYSVGYGARIGIGVLVLPGVHIGREALIGAGSLVTKDVPDFKVAYGWPATVRGEVPESERLR